MKQPEKKARNALIFNMWWTGATTGELAKAYGVAVSTIQKIILQEVAHRKLGRLKIVKELRNRCGARTNPPKSTDDIRDIVLREYGLGKK